jgi:hypothetical protein
VRRIATRLAKGTKAVVSGRLKAWSYSALEEYESGCPRRVYYGRVERREDPGGPALARGSRIHDEMYAHLKLGKPLPKEAEKFAKEVKRLRGRGLACEESWGFARGWKPTGWTAPDTWARIKTDAFRPLGFVKRKVASLVVDFKTGKRKKSHEAQGELYGVGAFARDPKLELAKVELWYIDDGGVDEFELTRKEAEVAMKDWAERGEKLLAEERWPTRPGTRCDWCAFSKKKGGPCKY